MKAFPIDPKIVALLGSDTRTRVLAVLANAYLPMTAYRVAKTGETRIPNTYRELARLKKAGLVGQSGKGWILLDADVKTLLRKRVRIHWSEDLKAEREALAPRRAELRRRWSKMPTPKFNNKGWQPRHPEQYERDPIKNAWLREHGLRTSIHVETPTKKQPSRK
jgi:DNA-binding transcriptional ArsR family regulator